jgi:hypothetical protein
MIDDPDKTTHLIERLRGCLPFAATLSPPLVATVRKHFAVQHVPLRCDVIQLHYAGDAGGIICGLALDVDTGGEVLVASITHLLVDRRMPLAREVATYQKHRVKKLRSQGKPV